MKMASLDWPLGASQRQATRQNPGGDGLAVAATPTTVADEA